MDNERMNALEKENEQLRARVKQLEDALRPFAIEFKYPSTQHMIDLLVPMMWLHNAAKVLDNE